MKRMTHKNVIEMIDNGETKYQTKDLIHMLRNPYGYSKSQIKRAQLQACDELEYYYDLVEVQNDGPKEER